MPFTLFHREPVDVSTQVVARYQDGRIVKGISLDVDPITPVCHVRPPAGTVVEVKLADLKALFFVRTLEGDPTHREASQSDPADLRMRGATPIKLKFVDGEQLIGLTSSYPPPRPYFFIVPVDSKSNNIRILVNRRAVTALAPVGGG